MSEYFIKVVRIVTLKSSFSLIALKKHFHYNLGYPFQSEECNNDIWYIQCVFVYACSNSQQIMSRKWPILMVHNSLNCCIIQNDVPFHVNYSGIVPRFVPTCNHYARFEFLYISMHCERVTKIHSFIFEYNRCLIEVPKELSKGAPFLS